MNADGSDQRRLTFQGSYNTAPAWSPDGRWIAYETQVGGQFDIWLIDPGGPVERAARDALAQRRAPDLVARQPQARVPVDAARARGHLRDRTWTADAEQALRVTERRREHESAPGGRYRR